MGNVKVLSRSTEDDLRQLQLLQNQLELTKLRLELKTARTQQEILLQKLKARQQTKQRKLAVLKAMRDTQEKHLEECLRDEAGKKLVTFLIECQSLNGIGPSKDIINSNLEKVIELLDKPEDIDLNMTDNFGRTALHLLCRISPTKLSLSALQKLIAKGQDIEIRSQCGKTGVHLCAETPNASALRILVKSGADVTVLSKSGISPTALEIAMTGLKFSASEYRANSHVYANMVSSLTFWNILQGEKYPHEVVSKFSNNWAVNQAILKGRNKARRLFETQLHRWLKVFVLVDMIIAYVGIWKDFCPPPSFPRNSRRSLRETSSRAKLGKSSSGIRRAGSLRKRAKTFTSSSSRGI